MTVLINELVESTGKTRLAVDNLIENFAIMAGDGKLKKGTHWLQEGNTLYLHFPSCLAEYQKWARERSLQEETLSKKAYNRQMQEIMKRDGYVKEKDAKNFGGHTMRVVVIDVQEAKKSGLDMGCFDKEVDDKTDDKELQWLEDLVEDMVE